MIFSPPEPFYWGKMKRKITFNNFLTKSTSARFFNSVCVVRWRWGENPLTPLRLIVDSSELFALMLMAGPHTLTTSTRYDCKLCFLKLWFYNYVSASRINMSPGINPTEPSFWWPYTDLSLSQRVKNHRGNKKSQFLAFFLTIHLEFHLVQLLSTKFSYKSRSAPSKSSFK